MHAADVACALEVLPPDGRRSVWEQVSEEQAARVFGDVDAVVAVPDTHTIERAIQNLRARGELAPQTDRVFGVDIRHVLVGSVVPLIRALGADRVQHPAAAFFAFASYASAGLVW